jgi:hypothetical protein
MKISDVLRQVADMMDQQSDPQSQETEIQNKADAHEVPAGPYGSEVETNAPDVEDMEDNVFLPPLQQKQELLKRAVEVNNVYDDEMSDQVHPDSELNLNNASPEINELKRRAGIMGMSDDEPLDQ